MKNTNEALQNLLSNKLIELNDFYNITIERNTLLLQGNFFNELVTKIFKNFDGIVINTEITKSGFITLRFDYNLGENKSTKIQITLT